MSGTKSLTSKFEQEIKDANEVKTSGKKERVWTPHSDDSYTVQTKLKSPQGPPPKRSIASLP
ncbi:hypothetical protein DICPUDRAFT_41979 [Dictyostelium purpureum]|uniref:Uncharacterized protein n=1 Tax=Dictyostelium purpureum TaxID=5786 RepID=F1A167_DICPU|nr:uncharacterized protein DICPUDRAFT_41979 [Dictyostelium purpureum]EGC30064.1 hypothetical protein DICPUDRAFT_41979 [Dictyostelium purpureum]|eukprot:XP_003293410.1 hypothetical protein DICPUDRAFT_41979 [Dictyostelium purpureum]